MIKSNDTTRYSISFDSLDISRNCLRNNVLFASTIVSSCFADVTTYNYQGDKGKKNEYSWKKQTLWCDMHSSSVCLDNLKKGGYFVASEILLSGY